MGRSRERHRRRRKLRRRIESREPEHGGRKRRRRHGGGIATSDPYREREDPLQEAVYSAEEEEQCGAYLMMSQATAGNANSSFRNDPYMEFPSRCREPLDLDRPNDREDPLPDGWEEHWDDAFQRIYYFNVAT